VTPVRFGLVGYGFGGRYFHAPLIASAAECDLMGIVTTSAERRELITGEHPGVAVFDSLEDLVAAGAEAVTICTPADTHSALTDQALNAGLATVCDKPFALDAAAVLRSVELAESLGLPLSPYQNRRWDSDFLTMRKLLAAGPLGTITGLESRFERFAPADGPPAAGGGTLLDFCSHLVDQALVLLGPAQAVYAQLRTRDTGLDDDVFLALTHADGVRSHIWGSWSQGAPGARFRLTGTDGTYVNEAGDSQEDILVTGTTPATLGDAWGVEPPERWGHVQRGAWSEPVRSEPGAWTVFYPAFAGAVRGEGAVPVNARDTVQTARVLDAARVSALGGVVVPISS
jgi:predicted dehydrogenase